MTQQRWSQFGWLGITLICVIYAPMASEYMLRFFDLAGLQWWDRLYAAIVGEQQALGPGSVFFEQRDAYLHSRLPLLVHTSLGGVILLLAASQFAGGFRQRHLAVHRWIGRALLGLTTIAMLSAMIYLLRTGPAATFSGPAFHIQLWALSVGTIAAIWAGFIAIRRHEIDLHRCLMAYAFALLLTAPLLRVLWLVLGLMWPDVTQEYLNIASGAILGLLAPGGAIVASRVLDSRVRTATGHRPMPGRVLEGSIGVLALMSLALLAIRYQDHVGKVDRLLMTLLLSYGLLVTALSGLAVTARQKGLALAAEEWRIHHLAALGCLPLYALMWSGYALMFTEAEAFYAAALTAPAAALTAGLVLVIWRRTEAPVPARIPVRNLSHPV